MFVVNPGNPDNILDAPHTGTVVQTGTYSRTGTGENQLVGYGRVSGVAASPTGNTSTQPVTTNKQNAASTVQAAIAAGGAIGFVIAGIIVLVGLVLLALVIRALFRG
jgi:hypothetical protein